MSLAVQGQDGPSSGHAVPALPGLPWTGLALTTAVLVAALYPVSASLIGPFGLPAAMLGLVLLGVSLARPGVGVAVAFLLTSLTPGLVGPRAWMPGVAWTALLFALAVLRSATGSADGVGTRLPPLSLPVLVYGATVLLAFGVASAGTGGVPILRSTASGILLFLVAGWTLRSWRDVMTVLLGASGAAVLVGGFACLQNMFGVATGIGFITSTGALVERSTAGFGHPNLLAGFLVVLAPIAGAAAVLDRRWRIVHVAGMVLALSGIYASFSRGALLALLIIPFVLVPGRLLLVLTPVVVIASSVALPAIMTERFVLGSEEGAQVAGRADIWATAGAIWLERPLLGAGIGRFPDSYAAIRVSGKQFLADTRFEPPPHAHSLPLQLLAEQGLVGFAAFGAVIAAAVGNAVRLRRSPHRRHALLGAAVLGSLVGLLVHNLFDVTMVENTGVQVWGILGLLSAVVALDRTAGEPHGP